MTYIRGLDNLLTPPDPPADCTCTRCACGDDERGCHNGCACACCRCNDRFCHDCCEV